MRKKGQNLFGWTHQASETAKFVRTASTSRQGLFREEPYKLDTSGKPILISLQTHYPWPPFLGPFAALLMTSEISFSFPRNWRNTWI